MNTNKKYVMIVTSEDERYGRDGIQLDFFWDNPWEGILEDIVFGDSYKELTCNGKYEGLFQQTYDIKTGTRLSYGGIDDLTPKEEIEEWENKQEKNDLKVLRQGKYMLGTIKDIAEELYDANSKYFTDCDFALIDNQEIDLNKDIDLEEIHYNSTGWYGIKNLDTGFNSDIYGDLNLFADYYGGSCGQYRFVYGDENENCIYGEITKMIVDTLSYQEGTIHKNMFIICETK